MAIREGSRKISFDASADEWEILKEYCELADTNKTEVLRGFVRSLKPKIKKLKTED